MDVEFNPRSGSVSLYGSLLPPELNLHPVGHLNCPSFLFNNFQIPSSRRVSPSLSFHQVTNPSSPTVDFYPHSFHQLTNPSSHNSLLFKFIQNPRGVPAAPPRQSLAFGGLASPKQIRRVGGSIFHFLFSIFCFPLSFPPFTNSWPQLQNSTSFFSAKSKLFLQNTGVWHLAAFRRTPRSGYLKRHRHFCLCSDESNSLVRQDHARSNRQPFLCEFRFSRLELRFSSFEIFRLQMAPIFEAFGRYFSQVRVTILQNTRGGVCLTFRRSDVLTYLMEVDHDSV
jgi:hypothetical protein